MPLPLTVSCSSKIQIGFTFLVPAHPVVPDKGPLNGCVCVCCLVGPFVRGEEAADVRWTVRDDDDDVVELAVSQLAPATNYTLLVYAENASGRSASAFGVYAVTGGQREIHSRSLPLLRLYIG